MKEPPAFGRGLLRFGTDPQQLLSVKQRLIALGPVPGMTNMRFWNAMRSTQLAPSEPSSWMTKATALSSFAIRAVGNASA